MPTFSRMPVHYSLSCALFVLYGTQVCPFLDSLRFHELTIPILLTFLSLYGVRTLLTGWLKSRDLRTQVKTQFKADLAIFLFAGIALSTYNHVVYDFPWGSGLKVIVGMTVTGFFIASDLGLRREHTLAIELSQSGQNIEIDQTPYPLTKKFNWFASICAAIFGVVVSLVVAKDLVWLSELSNAEELQRAAFIVSAEVAFVMLIMLAYIMTIISAYGSNLQLFFSSQQSALSQVANGRLSARVPVASNDEFGVIASHTNRTIESLQTRTGELGQMRDVTILALASLAETRDNETGAHILRTQQYVRVLAEHLKHHVRFKSVLTAAMIDLFYKSAPLHDAGKVGIPDAVLLKPGPLTADEFSVMKKHPLIGSQALESAQAVLGKNSFLSVASEIMETHHEKWDGSGYPYGLIGEQIPISGRLMALADVYDALTSERVYKRAFSHEEARKIIVDGRGSHFDPDIVDAFLELETTFRQVAIDFAKPESLVRPAA